MKKTILLLAFISFILSAVSAQSLRVSYYGETVTHYGLKVAREWTLRSYTKARNQARKDFFIAPALAAYRHPHNPVGFVLSPELTYRRTSRRGGILEAGLAPSYFHYFLEGSTYQPDPSGEFQRVPLAGGNAFLPTVFVGVGKDLSLRRQVPLAWYTRLNVMQQRPYNTSVLVRFSLEAGLILPLKKP